MGRSLRSPTCPSTTALRRQTKTCVPGRAGARPANGAGGDAALLSGSGHRARRPARSHRGLHVQPRRWSAAGINAAAEGQPDQRDWAGAANELRRWIRGGGTALPGLVARRELEARLVQLASWCIRSPRGNCVDLHEVSEATRELDPMQMLRSAHGRRRKASPLFRAPHQAERVPVEPTMKPIEERLWSSILRGGRCAALWRML